MNVLVLSTLFHFFALFFYFNIIYSLIIFTSTILSILWHLNTSYNKIIGIIDYLFAFIWYCADMYYFYNTSYFTICIFGNMTILLINQAIDIFHVNYNLYHSIWHILSAFKAIYFAYLLQCTLFVPQSLK